MKTKPNLDVSDFSNELKLLLGILRMDKDYKELPLIEGMFKDIDWSLFIELVKHHRVYPIIYKKIKNISENAIPSHIQKTLYELYKKNTFQMLLMSGEMERLGKLLGEHEIQTLFLKGPILASELYSDISLRTCNDIDLLIPQCDLGKMDTLLKENGYVKDDYIQTVLGDWKWRHHHVAYYNYEKGIKLEVHWRLNPGPSKEPSFYEMWKRKRKCSLFSSPVYYLGREDLFYFLVTHGARHGWSRLRWLVDISQLLKQEICVKQTYKLMQKYKTLHLCGQAVILTSQLIGTELKGEISQIATGKRSRKLAHDALFYIKQMINLHSEPLTIEVSKYHKYHLFSLMSFQHKLLFILSFLYPYHEDAITLPLPKKVHFLYFPLRPLLWVWRRVRKFAFTQEDIK